MGDQGQGRSENKVRSVEERVRSVEERGTCRVSKAKKQPLRCGGQWRDIHRVRGG